MGSARRLIPRDALHRQCPYDMLFVEIMCLPSHPDHRSFRLIVQPRQPGVQSVQTRLAGNRLTEIDGGLLDRHYGGNGFASTLISTSVRQPLESIVKARSRVVKTPFKIPLASLPDLYVQGYEKALYSSQKETGRHGAARLCK